MKCIASKLKLRLVSKGIHSVPACKQLSYKERLVKILPAKEQRLVERKYRILAIISLSRIEASLE